MSLVEQLGSLQDPQSPINILYPVDLSSEDELDTDSLSQWELLDGQVSDIWVND